MRHGEKVGLEIILVVVGGAPGIERIDRFQGVVEVRADTCHRLICDDGQGNAGVVRKVGEHLPFAPRIENDADPARSELALVREEGEKIRHLIHAAGTHHTVVIENGLVGRVVPGIGIGMDAGEFGGEPGPADLHGHHRDVLRARLLQGRREGPGVPRFLDEESDDPC